MSDNADDELERKADLDEKYHETNRRLVASLLRHGEFEAFIKDLKRKPTNADVERMKRETRETVRKILGNVNAQEARDAEIAFGDMVDATTPESLASNRAKLARELKKIRDEA